MKVTAYKTVEVECECDVEMDDIIREFSQRSDEATGTYWRRLVPAIDSMTRILASIKDETIAAMSVAARATICERLTTQAARYEEDVRRKCNCGASGDPGATGHSPSCPLKAIEG